MSCTGSESYKTDRLDVQRYHPGRMKLMMAFYSYLANPEVFNSGAQTNALGTAKYLEFSFRIFPIGQE